MFLVAYIDGKGAGHVQSLILGAVLFNAGVVVAALGVIGDLLSAQRTMIQRTHERVRRIELALGIAPSHYERGAPSPTRAPPTASRRAAHSAGAGREAAAARRARPRQRASRATLPATRIARPSSVTAVTRSADGTVTGNTYDKYGTRNPVARLLQRGFERNLDDLFASRRAELAARRRLRRGRADAALGDASSRRAASSASTSTTR